MNPLHRYLVVLTTALTLLSACGQSESGEAHKIILKGNRSRINIDPRTPDHLLNRKDFPGTEALLL